MPTSFLFFIVLYCLEKMNGERTVYSIYHLLTGKKSSQTIQDAHLFQLTPFFKTYRTMKRGQFDEWIRALEALHLIVKKGEQQYGVTENGKRFLRENGEKHKFVHHLNGWTYQQSDVFWERLTLMVQVVSHLKQNETSYIPIQRNRQTQEKIKGFLRGSGVKREQLAFVVFEELSACLEETEEVDPAVVVIRMTGYGRIGLTENQACEALNMEPILYHYQFLAGLHQLMKHIFHQRTRYPFLYALIKDLQAEKPLTESTKKTFELLKKGYILAEISQMRKLKISTIQDHIVELTIQLEDFDILPFVDSGKITEILEARRKAGSKQLRQIRELVPEADYFEIRLVMTKFGEDQ